MSYTVNIVKREVDMTNLLFVCTNNKHRSVTAADMLDGVKVKRGDPRWVAFDEAGHWTEEYETKSAGLAPTCRSEEHTTELQSRLHLVCRLLLEKKKKRQKKNTKKKQKNKKDEQDAQYELNAHQQKVCTESGESSE